MKGKKNNFDDHGKHLNKGGKNKQSNIVQCKGLMGYKVGRSL